MKFFTLIAAMVLLSPVKIFSQSLSPAEFREKLSKEKGTLIDVRTPEEFAVERIKGAININVNSDNFSNEIKKLDKKGSYFLYCGIGKRSMKALSIMKNAGFEKVYDLSKGLTQWKNEGYPIEKAIK